MLDTSSVGASRICQLQISLQCRMTKHWIVIETHNSLNYCGITLIYSKLSSKENLVSSQEKNLTEVTNIPYPIFQLHYALLDALAAFSLKKFRCPFYLTWKHWLGSGLSPKIKLTVKFLWKEMKYYIKSWNVVYGLFSRRPGSRGNMKSEAEVLRFM